MRYWDIVLVEWYDSSSTFENAWNELEDEMKDKEYEDLICRTAGILLRSNETDISITLSCSGTQVGAVITIPRVSIKSIRVLVKIERKDDI